MNRSQKQALLNEIYDRYDEPTTPYQRVLACPEVSNEVKQQLKTLHQTLNPFLLKKEIKVKLKPIFHQVKLSPKVK